MKLIYTLSIYYCFVVNLTCFRPENNDLIVLILARGGSRGVKLKNLSVVGGVSLVGRSVGTAARAGFTNIIVSTDHFLIAIEAWKHGCKVFPRSRVTASNTAPSVWGVAEFLYTHKEVDSVALLQATSPFTQPRQLVAAARLFEVSGCDCVFSVTRSYKLRWSVPTGSDSTKSLNFDPYNRPRRQDWQGEFIETGAFYFAGRALVEKGILQNENCKILEVDARSSFEIDSYDDLTIANVMQLYKIK